MVWRIKWWTLFVLIIPIFSLALPKGVSPVEFKKKKIKINDRIIQVELAESSSQQERGLMYRSKLEDDQGMLFIFPDERVRNFWMKNTYIDLSIGYFDKNRKLRIIIDMAATSLIEKADPQTYPSQYPAQYALEMKKGWFKKNKVNPGDQFDWY